MCTHCARKAILSARVTAGGLDILMWLYLAIFWLQRLTGSIEMLCHTSVIPMSSQSFVFLKKEKQNRKTKTQPQLWSTCWLIRWNKLIALMACYVVLSQDEATQEVIPNPSLVRRRMQVNGGWQGQSTQCVHACQLEFRTTLHFNLTISHLGVDAWTAAAEWWVIAKRNLEF